ncbi:MAG: hypothetical protein ACPGVA_04365 [Pikeienuella sp.]
MNDDTSVAHIVVNGQSVPLSLFTELVATVPGLADHFQLKLCDVDGADHLRMVVEATPDAAIEEMKVQSAYRLCAAFERATGIIADVHVASPGAVKREVGVPYRILDER